MDASGEQMKLASEKCGVKIYKMFGKYTVNTSEHYYKVCAPVVKDKDAKSILLDFGEVEEIDTAGFACVMNFMKEHLRGGAKIGIINVNRKEKDLAEILKIESAIKYYNSEEEAIQELRCD
ncbi:STAS domain-containing protein [Candidatus Omnitrophota bacterium]